MRISLDVHGVISKVPKFFSWYIDYLKAEGHEVFILTGQAFGTRLLRELVSYEIVFDKVLSITTYHRSIGTAMWYTDGDPEQPRMLDKVWDPTKATLCQMYNIDIHVDDSDVYGKYFTDTVYVDFKRFDSEDDFVDFMETLLRERM